MTSLDIAAVTGKSHKNVLQAIRNMEPAWERECERKFALTSEKVQMPQGGVRLMTVKDLNKRLVAEGVQFWNGGRYKLTKEYEGSGYARDRSFHYYALDGEKKERKYLVWTAVGMEFIRTIV